jgi:DUF438 domain-containing protein
LLFHPIPPASKPQAIVQRQKSKELVPPEGVLQFETGSLKKDEVEALLNTLPVDITFVDRGGTVKYFSKGEEITPP